MSESNNTRNDVMKGKYDIEKKTTDFVHEKCENSVIDMDLNNSISKFRRRNFLVCIETTFVVLNYELYSRAPTQKLPHVVENFNQKGAS